MYFGNNQEGALKELPWIEEIIESNVEREGERRRKYNKVEQRSDPGHRHMAKKHKRNKREERSTEFRRIYSMTKGSLKLKHNIVHARVEV